MRIFCSGFNLYGQFIKCPSFIIEQFVDYSCDCTRLEPSHSFNVVDTCDGVYIHGSQSDNAHQIRKLFNSDSVIKQIACVDTRILVLLENGILFKCNFENGSLVQIGTGFKKVSCGATINVAVRCDGSVFNLPQELCFKGDVKDIASGREHYLLLDGQGRVYSFGRGSRGQLGHGHLEDELKPKVVEALDGVRIGKIAAGGWHSCAVSTDGDLYVWGWNGNGQLGLYNDEKESIPVMATPQVVDFDDINVNVVDVACGYRHTIALLDTGKLYGSGWNKYRQLGNVTEETNMYKFRFLYNFENITVKELKCGPWSSLIICS